MKLSKGKIEISLDKAASFWEAKLGDSLIAVCSKDEWDLPYPEFTSKEAGELLLNQYSEIFAAMNTEADMVKDDEGLTKDLPPDASEKEAFEALSPDSEPEFIIIKLQSLFREAYDLKIAGKDYSRSFEEMDIWANRLDTFEKLSFQRELNELFVTAEQEVNFGFDCADTLDIIEAKLKIKDYEKGKDKEWLKQHPGRPTGSVSKAVELPVKWLATLPGLRGEDEVLKPSMPKVKILATLVPDKKWRDAHPISLEVHHDDSVFIGDGNHRVLACQLAGLEKYPCKIQFYGGSEDDSKIHKEIDKYAIIEHAKKLIEAGENPDSEILILATTYPFGKTMKCRGKECVKPATSGGLFCNDCRSNPAKELKPATAPGESPYVDKKTQQKIWYNNNKKASGDGVGGATDNYGVPTDQGYQNLSDVGDDYGGQYDPNKGNNPTINTYQGNEKEMNEKDKIDSMAYRFIKLHASSNKPCKTCGNPTDNCICNDSSSMSPGYTQSGTQRKNNPMKVDKGLPKELNPLVSSASSEKYDAMIKGGYIPDKFIKEASHIEEIEIPFKELHIVGDVDYRMSGQQQQLEMLAHKYLKMNVYPQKHSKFTIVSIQQDFPKLSVIVKCVVFDSGINHEAALGDVSNIKNSNIENSTGKMEKLAWKRRLTESIGGSDLMALVECPIEGNFLTRSCGTCPLAGNPETYNKDGYVECHFDDSTSWLAGKNIKEHRPLDSSSNI